MRLFVAIDEKMRFKKQSSTKRILCENAMFFSVFRGSSLNFEFLRKKNFILCDPFKKKRDRIFHSYIKVHKREFCVCPNAMSGVRTGWPSGLRRWIKAPISSEAWVRIPLQSNLFLESGSRTSNLDNPVLF